MNPPTIAVFDLDEKMTHALTKASAACGLRAATALPLPMPPEAMGAVVAGVLSQRVVTEPDAAGRLRQLRYQLHGAPLIAVADTTPIPRDEFSRFGFHAVVLNTTALDRTALRCIHAAIEARRATDLDLVGGSVAAVHLRREIELASDVRSHVLLLGETGTGKGVAARAIHALSARHSEPFETLDCGALSPALIESELFGHERGAFTGAHERRRGRLERAGEGSLFLDEIGELAISLQTKLLRALEERHFERLGGQHPMEFRARVIAATNRNLDAEVAAGRFRQDLLYRLDVLRLHLPPLRERLDDLPVLADHLLRRAATRLDMPPLAATAEMIEELLARSWPGNIRQLANQLEAMSVRGNLTLPATAPSFAPDEEPDAATTERQLLAKLLRECGGNVARVARRMDQPRSTVRYRIARSGLQHLIPRD